jgi:hypothetical protein
MCARSAALLATLVAGILFAACDGRMSPAAPDAVAPTVRAIAISGVSSTLSPGQTTQLTVTVLLSTNTSKAADNNEVSWHSSDTSVAHASTTGLLTATGAGETEIRAEYRGLSTTADVAVRQTLFRVSGTVHETAPTEHVTVPGARVEVVGGPLGGQVVETDGNGRFVLAPVATGDFYLYVKKPGYEDQRFWVKDLPRDQNPNIGIDPVLHEVFTGACWASCEPPYPYRRVFAFPLDVRRAGEIRLDFKMHSIDAGLLELGISPPGGADLAFWQILGPGWYSHSGHVTVRLPAGTYVLRAGITQYNAFEVTVTHQN